MEFVDKINSDSVSDLIERRRLEDDRYYTLYEKPKKKNKPTKSAEDNLDLLSNSGDTSLVLSEDTTQCYSRKMRLKFSEMIISNQGDGKGQRTTDDTVLRVDHSRDNKPREVIVASNDISTGSMHNRISLFPASEANFTDYLRYYLD